MHPRLYIVISLFRSCKCLLKSTLNLLAVSAHFIFNVVCGMLCCLLMVFLTRRLLAHLRAGLIDLGAWGVFLRCCYFRHLCFCGKRTTQQLYLRCRHDSPCHVFCPSGVHDICLFGSSSALNVPATLAYVFTDSSPLCPNRKQL